MKRRLLIALGVLAALVLVAVAGVWLLLDVNRYRGTIEARMTEQLLRKVTLGPMSLGLFPLRFRVSNLTIADDPTFSSQKPFVSADSVEVHVNLRPLLSGNVDVQSIALRRPSVEMIRNKQGVWNFSTLGPPPSKSPASGGTSSGAAVALSLLSITDGQVAVTDHQFSAPRSVYDHIDFTLRDYKAGQPFKAELSAHLPGSGASEIRLAGEGGPIPPAGPAATPFNGTLAIREVGVEGMQAFLSGQPAVKGLGGSLSGETRIHSQSGELGADGKLTVNSLRLNGLDVGYPIVLDYDLASKVETGILGIRKANLQLGKTPLALTGSINTSKSPAWVDLGVKSGNVSIEEIARLASAFGIAFAPGSTVSGKVAVDIQAKGPVDDLALNGTVAGSDLEVSSKDMPAPVRVKTLNLALTPNEIRTNEFTATSGKTALNGRFAVKQYRSAKPLVDAALNTSGAEFSEIQTIAKGYGFTGLDQLKGAGALKLDLKAAGPAQALDAASLIKAVSGTIDLDFSPMQIKGFDVVKELATIGKFSAAGENANLTDLLKLTGQIAVKDGIAQTSDLRAQFTSGSLSANGAADLASSNLNMKLAAVFSKAVSDKVGGNKVGGYLTTALSNQAGELVVPAIVTGAFTQPKFAPDLKAVVELQKQKYLPTLSDPRSALSGIMGAFGRPKEEAPVAPVAADGAQQPAAPAAGSKTDAVKGILGGLFGGKK